jgi:endogenous inhibitor of DNA gyrase (YacG/DUF329 family)
MDKPYPYTDNHWTKLSPVAYVPDAIGRVWCCFCQNDVATQAKGDVLVVRVQQRRPKVMSRAFPVDLSRTVLQPICQSHVAVGEINSIRPSCL